MPTIDATVVLTKLTELGVTAVAVALLAGILVFAVYIMWKMQQAHAKQVEARDKIFRDTLAEQLAAAGELFRRALADQQAATGAQLREIAETFRVQLCEQGDKFSADLERVMHQLDQHTGALQALSGLITNQHQPPARTPRPGPRE